MLVQLSLYPQLQLIAWNRLGSEFVTGEEALSLYEEHWRFIDEATLTPEERQLIDRLVLDYGNGVLLV